MDQEKQTFNCRKLIYNFGRCLLTCIKRFPFKAWKVFITFVMSCFRRRDSGEAELIKASCKNCKKLEKTIADMQENLDQALAKLDQRKKQLDCSRGNYESLQSDYEILKERSNAITTEMAKILESKGSLENINDDYSNSKLAKKFKTLYDKNWEGLAEWLDENSTLKELQRIKHLTDLMQQATKECVSFAERQMRQFLLLSEDDRIPSSKDEPELFKVRRQGGQQERFRKAFIKEVMDRILTADNTNKFCTDKNKEETEKQLQGFFHEFIDCCWLMTISNPRLLLNFNVVGLPYSGRVKENFGQYSCQDTVESDEMEKDCVFLVVWPSVELEDSEGIFAKGDLITVQKGKTCQHSDNTKMDTS